MYAKGNPIRWIDRLGLRPGDYFDSPAEAAQDAIQYTWDEMWDYGYDEEENCGWIRPVCDNGEQQYTYDEPSGSDPMGAPGECLLPPPPPQYSGWWHTHPVWGEGQFSDEDMLISDESGVDGFLGTPDQNVLQYDPDTWEVNDLRLR